MKLLVLDGNSIINRAFYGIRLLTTKDGIYTNGIYGFLTIFQKLMGETSPDAVAVAFDMRAPTFRHKEYAGYKANRKGMPPELAQQMPTLKELLTLFGYKLVECEGYEADDILGTLAEACKNTGDECVLATGDRDSLQLAGNGVTVRLASTKMGKPLVTVYDEEKIKADYGVLPKEMIEIKALQGDTSDCIPGVAGIGPKGAGQLIQKYHSIDYIYENLDSLDIKENMRKKLTAGRENAFLSRKLGTICTNAPINTDIKNYIPKQCDRKAAARLMAKLEFFSLIKKFGLDAADVLPPAEQDDKIETAEATDLKRLFNDVTEAGRADFIADYKKDGKISSFTFNSGNKIYTTDNKDFIFSILTDKSIDKNTNDIKPLYAALIKESRQMSGRVFDTMLAGYILDPSAKSYEPKRLAQEYGVPVPSGKMGISEEYAAVIPKLTDKLTVKLGENGQSELYFNIEIPLARVLAEMEVAGFAVDADGIKQYGNMVEKRADKIKQQIYSEVGYEFNINSPKQLGDALFVKLGLSHGKKNKTGYSTSAKALEKLRYEHPAVELALNYRTLTKLKSTYSDGLLKVIDHDGRIHSSFNQTETRTGRISSTEPNLQNIPVRTDLGRELRRFFIARPGWMLVDADYSQIELRVLAHVANDKNMIGAFLRGDDIHRSTAAQVFHMPEEMVTPLMRSRAKAVNFGIVYGIGAFSLSKNIHVSVREAKKYIEDYLSHYSGVDEYMKRVVKEAKERGYAETIFGRRRYLPELVSSNFNIRSFGERVARNMPIQGTAADIIKIAMVKAERRLKKEGMQSKLILQVHDELIVESPESEAEKAAALLTEEMQNAVSLSVPMVAETKIGKTWYDAKA